VVSAALARRDPDLAEAVARIVEFDAKRRDLIKESEALKATRNTNSEKVAQAKKTGEDATVLLGELKQVSSNIKNLDQALREVEDSMNEILMRIPNIPLDTVPVGDASANEVVRTWGEKPSLNFSPLPHWEIGENLGILDLPRGAKISGSGFPVYVGLGSRLVRGLVSFMLDLHTKEHGYKEVWPPALVNAASATGTGQLPDLEENMYVTGDELYLVPTAEVPITNLHRDEILDGDKLPFGYAAYSPCFRREAGAHGKDTRGITRVHQFDKVELVRFTRPELSSDELETLLGHAETVLQKLGLPYRVLALATGDLGFSSAKTYDLEVYAAGTDSWLEVSSASVFTDFQARRAKIRYRPEKGGKPDFVHTLNASGLALPRTIIALLENYQQEDGSVKVPECLVPYIGVDRLTPDGG